MIELRFVVELYLFIAFVLWAVAWNRLVVTWPALPGNKLDYHDFISSFVLGLFFGVMWPLSVTLWVLHKIYLRVA